MAKKRHNLISFLLDRSGSMGTIWKPTIDGFNEFLSLQKSQSYRTTWQVSVFDSQSIDVIRRGVKDKDMLPLEETEISPRGLTPLLDAINQTIHETDKLNEKFDGVVFVILTDGLENASQETTQAQVRKLIQDREEKGWQVIFLGANMDAMEVARDYGLQAGSTVTFAATAGSVHSSYSVAAAATTNYGETGQTVSRHTDTTDGTVKERDTQEVSS